MELWLRISQTLDRLNERIGRAAGWLTLLMVLLGAGNALVRYFAYYAGWTLSNAFLELQWYLFSLVFLLAGAYALRLNVHVRVDLLYGRLGRRGRAWIDLVGTILFLMPFSVFILWVSWPSVRNSWAVLEGSPDPGGLPRYPLKSMILVAFVLLLLQGLSEVIKKVAVLRNLADEPEPEPAPEPRELSL